jgi:diguanylate cyclase (GGDEF)-like protein/PAS domain S-box-containing protein
MKADRILLVLADAAAGEAACGQLRAAGYLAEQARDAAHAFELASADAPGLVLIDQQLADASGDALLQRLKADPALADVFVVLQRQPEIAGSATGPLQADAHVRAFRTDCGLDELAASWLRLRRTTTALRELIASRQPAPTGPEPMAIRERSYTSLFSKNPDAVYSLDLQGCFLSVNPAFVRMTGYSEEEIRGRQSLRLVSPATMELARALFVRATAGEPATDELECVTSDDRRLAVLITNVPIVVDGKIVGIYGMAKDLTRRKDAERQLQSSKERLKIASRMARLGSWEVDLRDDRLSWSDEVCAIFGLPEGTVPRKGDGLRHYAPEFRAQAQALFEACAQHGTPFDEELQIIAQGRPIWVRSIAQAVRDEDGTVVRVHGVLQDITERKQADAAMQRLGNQLTTTVESMTDAFMTLDSAGRFTYLNAEAERILQTGRNSILGKQIWREFELVAGSNFERQFHVALAEGRTVTLEEFYSPLGLWLNIRYYPTTGGLAVYFRDITEDKRTAKQLARSHRALDMLNSCNEALIRVRDEHELLDQVCRIAVERGGYKGAWVGFARDDDARSISVDAQAGDDALAAHLDSLHLGWDEGSAAGRSPAGRTIRSGMPEFIVNRPTDPSFEPRRAAAQTYQYGIGICLPLRHEERTFGLLTMYSEHERALSAEESGLLQKLADDLAFGIQYLRSQVEQARVQAVVSKVAAGVSARSDGEFFRHLALCMAEALEAQASFVARIVPGAPRMARTIAAAVNGQLIANFSYAIDGRPCERLLDSTTGVVIGAWNDAGSPPEVPVDFAPRSYVGRRLDNAAGDPVGLLFVLYRKPVAHSDFIVSTLDIFAARAVAELEHEESDARIRAQAALLDKAQDAIIVLCIDDHVEYWNKSAERLFGWTAEEACRSSMPHLLYDDGTRACFNEAVTHTRQHGEWHGELVQRHKNGSQLIVEARWTLVNHADGKPPSILSINTDISARKAAEQKIENLAFYDPLTGLPNRQLLLDRLQRALNLHERNGNCGSLLFIDLDNFKALNDTRGHATGDLLLIEVARRLASCVRGSDTVARLGGDEFVVMLEGLDGNLARAAIQAKAITHNILTALSRTCQLDGISHHTSASIGIALFSDASEPGGDLLKHADMAMYQAKALGRNTLCFFNPEMQTAVNDRVMMEVELREGLQRQQFQLFYQAQVDECGNPTGVEALLRWNHPQRGLIYPLEFIALAEDAWLILPLGQWVLETACNQLTAWSRSAATARLDMSVNVSARQFRHPDFVQQVVDILRRSGANPRRLKLELTESLLLSDVDDVIAKMTALKTHGVGFSLDDFGTGYSSLSYLKRLPLDQLKIDRSFVSDLLSDSNDAAIVHSIIALGQSLGLQVLAEGVENEGQRDFLERHRCCAYQGYLFCRPLPIDQFETWLTRRIMIA